MLFLGNGMSYNPSSWYVRGHPYLKIHNDFSTWYVSLTYFKFADASSILIKLVSRTADKKVII